MTDSGQTPHIVHRPDNRLPESGNAPDAAQREHTLIDPVEAYHVGAAHERMAPELQSVGCCVGFEEVAAVEAVGREDFQPLGQKGDA